LGKTLSKESTGGYGSGKWKENQSINTYEVDGVLTGHAIMSRQGGKLGRVLFSQFSREGVGESDREMVTRLMSRMPGGRGDFDSV